MPINAINVIRDQIDASIQNANAALGFGPATGADTDPYPLAFYSSNNATAIDQSNWNESPFPYIFAVTNQGGAYVGGFRSFELPLNPQSITQTELFAHSIKPTQGGTVVTHSGNRYKSLRISGTTGIAPFRGTGGVNPNTGVAYFQPGGIKYKSGYEVFLLLRNYFKAYYEFKADGRLAQDSVLVFRNYKDGEYLAVELMSFNMKRDASRPFLYDYDLEFKVLRALSFSPLIEPTLGDFETKLNDISNKIATARGVFLGATGALRQVEATFNSTIVDRLRLIGLGIKALTGGVFTLADVGTRIIRNTFTLGGIAATLAFLFTEQQTQSRVGGGSTTLEEANLPTDPESAANSLGADALVDLGPLLDEIDIAQAPQETRNALDEEVNNLRLTKQFVQDTIDNLQRVSANLEDFVGFQSTAYDTLFDRTSTVTATTGRVPTNDEFDILNAFNLAVDALSSVLTLEVLFATSYPDEIASINAQFSNNIDLDTEPAVREITLRMGNTLEQVALEYLDDATRWPEIAILNGLKPPYICQEQRLPNTLVESNLTTEEMALYNLSETIASPGDTILIPAPLFFGFGETITGAEISILDGLSQVEKNIGADFRIDEETRDLILTNGGDIQAIAGSGNMAQSIILRLLYEPGEILSNPGLGVGLNVGSKIAELSSIRDDVTRSLLQDPRIQNIEEFTIVRDGPQLRLRFTVRLKQVDQPIPIELALPAR